MVGGFVDDADYFVGVVLLEFFGKVLGEYIVPDKNYATLAVAPFEEEVLYVADDDAAAGNEDDGKCATI